MSSSLTKTDTRIAAALLAAAFVASNWVVAFVHASYAWHVGAALVVLLMERFVRASAPSPLGWIFSGASLKHFCRVAAVSAAFVLIYIIGVVATCRLSGHELIVEPQNIRKPSEFLGWIWLGVVVAPLVEEWIYRGLIQPRLRESLGARWAIAVCGVLFWLYHWFAKHGVTAPHHLLAGWLFSWSWQRTGSLVAPTLLHALGNLCLGLMDLLLLTQPRLVGSLLGS
jgi:membrane protease YdiL (CAAX protease family)